jgi:hypothetical protein
VKDVLVGRLAIDAWTITAMAEAGTYPPPAPHTPPAAQPPAQPSTATAPASTSTAVPINPVRAGPAPVREDVRSHLFGSSEPKASPPPAGSGSLFPTLDGAAAAAGPSVALSSEDDPLSLFARQTRPAAGAAKR